MTQTANPIKLDQEKVQEALRIAKELFRQEPDWMIFFRETLGVGGVASRLFPTAPEMEAFQRTSEHAQIQQWVGQLKAKPKAVPENGKEETRVITVRLPASLHDALRAEAHDRETSMNQLCIIKLLQVVGEGLFNKGKQPEKKTE